ncbi:hypothetical protein [Paenibacillus sp. FSL R5-0914]|uniref:hypothetical protein n=1 Tax=Paenibacillus sp. FSL R5-0914 TaxID=2921665 RepID=UPI0030F4E706
MIKKLKAMINAQPQNTIFSAMYDYLIQYRNEHGNLSGGDASLRSAFPNDYRLVCNTKFWGR